MAEPRERKKTDGPLPWIKVFHDLPTHDKSDELEVRLGVERAWTHVVELWLWVSQRRPDGDLSDLTNQTIAKRAGFSGDPDAFVEALRVVEFLDDDGFVHDWEEQQEEHVKRERKRKVDAERKRKSRRIQRAAAAETAESGPSPTAVTDDVRVTPKPCPRDTPCDEARTPSLSLSLSSSDPERGVQGGEVEAPTGRPPDILTRTQEALEARETEHERVDHGGGESWRWLAEALDVPKAAYARNAQSVWTDLVARGADPQHLARAVRCADIEYWRTRRSVIGAWRQVLDDPDGQIARVESKRREAERKAAYEIRQRASVATMPDEKPEPTEDDYAALEAFKAAALRRPA